MRECSVLGWGRGDNEIYSKRKLVCDFPVQNLGIYQVEGAEEKAVPRLPG